MENQGIPKPILIIGAVVILGFILSSKMFYNIEPGQRAIQFKTLSGGLDKETMYTQGLNIIAPWNRLECMILNFNLLLR